MRVGLIGLAVATNRRFEMIRASERCNIGSDLLIILFVIAVTPV